MLQLRHASVRLPVDVLPPGLSTVPLPSSIDDGSFWLIPDDPTGPFSFGEFDVHASGGFPPAGLAVSSI